MSTSPGLRKRYIFLITLVVLVGVYWFSANQIIRHVLEDKLTEAYGAQVDIDSVSHRFFPTSVTLNNIALTDPLSPQHNKVQISQAYAQVELLPLLSSQAIVDELNVLDVQFNQPRQSPGKVLRQPAGLSLEQIKDKASAAVPSVEELIARNPLKTPDAVSALEAAYNKATQGLKQQYAALPDKHRVTDYQARVKALKELDYKNPQALLTARNQLETLKQSVSDDKQQLSDFAASAQNVKSELSQAVAQLNQARKDDMTLLKGVLARDAGALNQVTYLIFGDKAAEYNEYLMSAFNVVMPLINGSPAASDAPASEPFPVLVKQARVSVKFADEAIVTDWQNITNLHSLFGNPTTFSISTAGDMFKQFASSGQFWIDDNGVDAQQQWSLAGISLAGVDLLKSSKVTAQVLSTLLATKGSLTISDDALSGSADIRLSDLAMQASGSGQYGQAIAQALSGLNKLGIDMNLAGSVTAPQFSLSSDLDNQLASAALRELAVSQQDKLDALQAKLNGMGLSTQQATRTDITDINSMLSAVSGNADSLESLLQTRLDSVVDEQKNKLLDKLKGKFQK